MTLFDRVHPKAHPRFFRFQRAEKIKAVCLLLVASRPKTTDRALTGEGHPLAFPLVDEKGKHLIRFHHFYFTTIHFMVISNQRLNRLKNGDPLRESVIRYVRKNYQPDNREEFFRDMRDFFHCFRKEIQDSLQQEYISGVSGVRALLMLQENQLCRKVIEKQRQRLDLVEMERTIYQIAKELGVGL